MIHPGVAAVVKCSLSNFGAGGLVHYVRGQPCVAGNQYTPFAHPLSEGEDWDVGRFSGRREGGTTVPVYVGTEVSTEIQRQLGWVWCAELYKKLTNNFASTATARHYCTDRHTWVFQQRGFCVGIWLHSSQKGPQLTQKWRLRAGWGVGGGAVGVLMHCWWKCSHCRVWFVF